MSTGIGNSEPRSELGTDVISRTIGPWVHVAPPEDVAAVICFLTSDEARNVNGAVLVADAGWTAI